MTEQAERQTEFWAFTGLRDNGGKAAEVWRDPDGKLLVFTPRRGRHFSTGGHYEVTVTRASDGVTRHGDPKYLGPLDSPEDIQLWRAEERADLAHLERLKRERNDARQKELDEALEPLVAIARKMRTGAQRDEFAAYVLRRIISGAGWR